MMNSPTDVVLDRAQNQLSVTWDDEAVSVMPVPYLRRWCPCAVCQGHGGRVTFLAELPETEAKEISQVGVYALRILFADGHDTGIYSWTWLRRLAPESPPTGLKAGVFVRGQFRDAGEAST